MSLNVLNDIEFLSHIPVIGADSPLNKGLKNAATTLALMLIVMSMVLSVISLRNARDQLLREREVLKAEVRERFQVEEALQASEEKYKTFFENSCDPMQLLEGGKFLECNASTVEILGYDSKEEVLLEMAVKKCSGWRFRNVAPFV
jgi:PAS domain-containing protein